ncbi:MAG TPA: carboxyl transferase domain-containing protein [Acidimicrobiales bacterium]|nr:carboxyl transferase domain-containing protein [Acidimicrobiales bacterium]
MVLHPLQSEWDADLRGGDPLGFPDYVPPSEAESVVTGRTVAGYALIEGRFDVLGGSMGAAHGERVVRAYRRAADERLPVVVVTRSGGARMQEGMVSLVQMARTAAAARAHADAGLLQVAVHRSPTTGGVFASYSSLADVRAAEPGALIGFAGPRVVEITTGARLPADSHTAESAYRAGLVDALVERHEQGAWVEAVLGQRPRRWHHEWTWGAGDQPAPDPSGGPAERAFDTVLRARSAQRPPADAWAARLCESWVPLHSTDPAVRAGLARFEGRRLIVVATARARPGPAGYRSARRAFALAGRLGLPVLTLVDTPGADPSAASEAGGIAGEIARTFAAMAALPVPTVGVCVGEGGSGGALALTATDRLLILEDAVFSVISPEGAAAILDRSPDTAPQRAADLKLTSADLLRLGVVDEVIREDEAAVRRAIVRALDAATPDERHRRFDAVTERALGA